MGSALPAAGWVREVGTMTEAAVVLIAYLSGIVTCWLYRYVREPYQIETRAERLLEGERFG